MAAGVESFGCVDLGSSRPYFNLNGSSLCAYLFPSGWRAAMLRKIHRISYYCKYFFNRSQAVLSVGKMGEGARDGCKRIC